MTKARRHHPLLIVLGMWNLAKGSVYLFILLFVIKYGSKSAFVTYGRLALLAGVGISILYIIGRWYTQKYWLDDHSIYLNKGIFVKSKSVIPFTKIQNINRHTTLFHRIFRVTSIRFETGMEGEDSDIEFRVISLSDADLLEQYITGNVRSNKDVTESSEKAEDLPLGEVDKPERTVHFKPTRQDLFKASFTSLSFLVLIPILWSLYDKVNDLLHIEKEAQGFFSQILSSWWMVALIILGLTLIGIVAGIVKTYLVYGNYVISSDSERIYISKGLIEQMAFSISKNRVQGIEIKQTIMKRILGLAEVKLITAGGSEDKEEEVNSLYPFLPVKQAYAMVSEILPSYEVKSEMKRLSRTTFWIHMLRPSWIWINATALLIGFKPSLFGMSSMWVLLSAALLVLIWAWRILNFYNTGYLIHGHFIQFRSGGFTTSLFISKREKIVEINVTRGLLQRKVGLASIHTINRAKPISAHTVNDIPLEFAELFRRWYVGRTQEVKVEG